jgi:thiamine biosynthesis lipoprotein
MLDLDPQSRTIRFQQQGMMLNLGSIGKGYALDRCARMLAEAAIEDFLVHGGQSSVIASGGRLTGDDDQKAGAKVPWAVGIRHPLRPDRKIAEIHLRDKALATSGSRTQSFRHEGRRYGHIIDPRNGQPAEGIISATAIAPSAAEADALSTAFYVMSADETLEYCEAHGEIGAVLVCPIRHSGGVELRTAGLEEGELQVL